MKFHPQKLLQMIYIKLKLILCSLICSISEEKGAKKTLQLVFLHLKFILQKKNPQAKNELIMSKWKKKLPNEIFCTIKLNDLKVCG